MSLKGKKFLEPGAGSGLISIYAAKKGARVTATDINPVAIEFLRDNSEENNVQIDIIQSDLFENIPLQHFDIIAINPPYYKKNPADLLIMHGIAAENGEYFFKLF